MTDAQTFYLLLAAFYLYECLSFAPCGAQAFVFLGKAAWRWREPAFHLSGTDREVFCAPLIPWRSLLAVFSPAPTPTTPQSDLTPALARHHLRKRTLLLGKITAPLRRWSTLLFVHYFIIFPLVYFYLIGTIWVLVAILLGEIFAFITAARFYGLHKRLFPEAKGERRLETFYHAFFPWHSMRASDLIVRQLTARWDPLLLLTSAAHHPKNTRQLARRWRQASHAGETKDLARHLDLAELDPTPWTLAPTLEPGQTYCPVCRTLYDPGPTHCADCPSVALIEKYDTH